jgi:hypothetical protein
MGKIFIANWKENPMSEKEAISLAKTSDSKSVVVFPQPRRWSASECHSRK